MIRLLAITTLAVLGFAAEATAQTRTSTGVEFEASRLDEELGEWEAGARGAPGGPAELGGPGAPTGPGAPRVDDPPEAVPLYEAPATTRVETTVDERLLEQGRLQRACGRVALYAGIGAAVAGTAMFIAGAARSSGDDTPSTGNGLLMLSGLALGGLGGGGIVVGSVLMHRGGKKMDKARRATSISSLAPALLPGGAPGLLVAGEF